MRMSSSIVPNGNNINPYRQFLDDMVNKSSISFRPLVMLPNPIHDPFLASYLFVRIIDEIEDNMAIHRDDKNVLIDKVRTMLYGDKQSALDLEERFRELRPSEDRFKSLLNNIVSLFEAHETLPGDAKKITKEYIGEMTLGLRSPGIRNYFNFEGYHQYCHYTTGLIGLLTSKLLNYGGFFDSEKLRIVMPYPESFEIGKNPAHDWGISIQLWNDIRDFYDDYSQGKYKWPRILFDSRDINYGDLIKVNDTRSKKNKLEAEIDILPDDDPLIIKKRTDLDKTQRKIENIEGAHYEICNDAKEYYLNGIKFIETMPFESPEIMKCFGGIYAVVGATGRVVSSSEFLYNQNKRNITEGEFKSIFRIVNRLIKQNKSLRSFLEHVIEKPAEEFELK